MACELFGFSQEDLLGVELNDLVTLKSQSPSTVTESYLDDSGDILEVSGKVVRISFTILYACSGAVPFLNSKQGEDRIEVYSPTTGSFYGNTL